MRRDDLDLLSVLPHRPPMRLVDRIVSLVPHKEAFGQKDIAEDDFWLAGHFPGNPVFPGVLQLEALAQTGAVAVLADSRFARRLPLFGGVEKARFRRVVRPGDELLLEVTMERLSARGGWGVGRASVDGATTCEARLLFAFG